MLAEFGVAKKTESDEEQDEEMPGGGRQPPPIPKKGSLTPGPHTARYSGAASILSPLPPPAHHISPQLNRGGVFILSTTANMMAEFTKEKKGGTSL